MKLNKMNFRLRELTNCVALATIVTLLVWVIFKLWLKDFGIPFFYNSDGIGALLTIKNISEGGDLWNFINLNAPHQIPVLLVDFILPAIVIKIISLFTNNIGIIANLFWLLTYVFTACITYLFLRRCRCHPVISCMGGIIYAFLPYHYFRTVHFWLMGCYVIPLGLWIIVDILEGQLDSFKCVERSGKPPLISKQILKLVFFAMIIGLNGIYYAVFTLIFMWIAILIKSIQKHTFRDIIHGVILTSAMLLPIIIFFIVPLLIYGATEANSLVEARTVYQMNFFSLQPFLMFLPIPEHRINSISNFTATIYDELSISGEGYMVNLGLVMVLGLIASLIYVFVYKKTTTKEARLIVDMGKMNIAAILIASTGGLSLFIGIFFTTVVRCFNRIIVFIALFSITCFCLVTQLIFTKLKIKRKKIALVLLCGIITIVAILDQTTSAFATYTVYNINERKYERTYDENAAEYKALEQYVEKVEENLNEGDMILQLPLISDRNQFDQAKLAVVSDKVKWSSTVTDNKQQAWLNNLSKLDNKNIIKVCLIMGFSGILLDKDCYATETDFERDRKEIQDYLQNSPVVSESDTLYYYSLSNTDMLKNVQENAWNAYKEALENVLYGNANILGLQDLNYNGDMDFTKDIVAKNTLQFGPYIDLNEGTYIISILGTNLNDAEVSCTSNSGQEKLSLNILTQNENIIQYSINLQEFKEDVEFLLKNDKEDLKIFLYAYHQTDDVDEDMDNFNLLKDLISE